MFVTTALVGLALGCMFRFPAVLIASILLIGAAAGSVRDGDMSMGLVLALLGTLQGAYVVGLLCASLAQPRSRG